MPIARTVYVYRIGRRGEVLGFLDIAGEAREVADLVEDRQAQMLADAGRGLAQDVIARGDFLGEPLELGFQGNRLLIEMAGQDQFVLERELADGVVFTGQQSLLRTLAWTRILPWRSRRPTNCWRAWRSIPWLNSVAEV